MTAKELSLNIGKRATIVLGKLIVQVRIMDAKNAYGVDRYQIETYGSEYNTPADRIWVNADRIRIEEGQS